MTTPVTFNGNTYRIPVNGETGGWGVGLTTYLAALAAGAAGLNVQPGFTSGVGFVPQTAPTQTTNVQVFAGTDGNLYAMAAIGNTSVPAQLTPASGGGGSGAYVNKTANYQLLIGDSGTHFTTHAAGGAVTFTLPASPVFGENYAFTCNAAQDLVVSGGTLTGPAGLTGTSLTIHGATAGNRYTSCKVAYDGAAWIIEYVFGTAVVA